MIVPGAGSAHAADVTMRVAGNFSSNVRHSEGIERPFFTGLPKSTGIDMEVGESWAEITLNPAPGEDDPS